MAEKVDRRVRRTRRRLTEALVELILEKRYEEITVQDILDRADVGRSTFYAHYRSKDDLLVSDAPFFPVDDFADEEKVVPSLLPAFQHMAENHHLFRALVGGEGVELIDRAVEAGFMELITRQLGQSKRLGIPLTRPKTVMIHFITGGLMSLVKWWLNERMPIEPEELDRLYMDMADAVLG